MLLKHRIVTVITEKYDIPMEDIVRRVRKKDIVEPRQVIAYCLRLLTDMSFPDIGEVLGGRDHTTIMHSCSKVANKIELNEKFRAKIDIILNAIRNPEAVPVPEQQLSEEISPEVPIVAAEAREPQLTDGESIIDEKQTYFDIPKKNLELSAKERDMLDSYRRGMTLQEIAKGWLITRERVRQIIRKAMLKLVGAKLQDGFDIDINEFLKGERSTHQQSSSHKRNWVPDAEKEKLLEGYTSKASSYISVEKFAADTGMTLNKLRYSFPEITEIIEKKIQEKRDRWSRYYSKCRNCGTTTIPHIRKGYCERCIGVYRGDRRENLLGENSICAVCSIDRKSANGKFGRDLFITKDGRVLCRGCFLQLTGSKLAQSRHDRS